MKSNKKDNKKIHESWIGKIIYGFLMFIPLLAIGITCLYVVFNDNAFESYYGETINEEQVVDITSLSGLKENKSYLFTISNTSLSTNNSVSNMIFVTNVHNVVGTNGLQNTFSFTTYQYQTTKHLYIKNSDNTTNDIVLSSAISFEFDYLYNTIADETAFQSHFANSLRVYEYNKYSYLDNVFVYSIESISKNNLFNWTQNSIIYTGMSATTQSLNIETPFIPMLLTYWLIISVLYFLYDIILIIFHVLHRKIHELEESI